MSGQNTLVEVLSDAQSSLGVSTEEFVPLVLESLGQMLVQKARADVKDIEEQAKADAKALCDQAHLTAQEIEEKAKAIEQKALESAKLIEEKARAIEEQAHAQAKQLAAEMVKAQSNLTAEKARQEKARNELAAEAARQVKDKFAFEKKQAEVDSDKASTASGITHDHDTDNFSYAGAYGNAGFGNGDLFIPAYESWAPPMYTGGYHSGGFGNGTPKLGEAPDTWGQDQYVESYEATCDGSTGTPKLGQAPNTWGQDQYAW